MMQPECLCISIHVNQWRIQFGFRGFWYPIQFPPPPPPPPPPPRFRYPMKMKYLVSMGPNYFIFMGNLKIMTPACVCPRHAGAYMFLTLSLYMIMQFLLICMHFSLPSIHVHVCLSVCVWMNIHVSFVSALLTMIKFNMHKRVRILDSWGESCSL